MSVPPLDAGAVSSPPIDLLSGGTDGKGVRPIFDEPPAFGERVLVAPGIYWLRLRLPFRLNHVNVWLLEDNDGWTLIDTGLHDAETLAVMERVFADELDGKPISRLLVTHHHPDHCGIAAWIVERWGCPLLMSRTEWLVARLLSSDSAGGVQQASTAFYRRSGLDDAWLLRMESLRQAYPRGVLPPPTQYQRLRDGDTLGIGGRQWRVLTAGGHAPEQVMLFSATDKILIGADQVLGRITPNIGVVAPEPDAGPLSEFLASLARLEAEIPAETLVLPSHGVPFFGLHPRLRELRGHHGDRLNALESACTEPCTAAALLPVLFQSPVVDTHQMFFAMGELVAHLNHLLQGGRITRVADPTGVFLYSSA